MDLTNSRPSNLVAGSCLPFWIGGADAYYDALRAEHKSALLDLNQQLRASETLGDVERIEQEIVERKQAYREKVRGIDRLLF